MKNIFFIISSLCIIEINAQNIGLNQTGNDDPFVCSYKCNNSFNNLKVNCFASTISPLRQEPIKNYNVNPYDEFNLIIATLKRERNNPFPLLYSFRECESVCNAASVIVDSSKYIFYNQSFLNNLKSTNDKLKWIVRSIIAHEIGHHILEHTVLGASGVFPEERRKQELRADYFSAYVIKQFPGSTLDDALSGINSLDIETYLPKSDADEDGSDYPTLKHRITAITEGFNDNENSPLRIGMFRNIDSVALISYKIFGRSIILHEVDKDISFGNFNEAKEKIDQLLKLEIKEEEKSALMKVKILVINQLKKVDDNRILIDKPFTINKEDVEVLKDIYEKYKNGKTGSDKRKADTILKTIKELDGIR